MDYAEIKAFMVLRSVNNLQSAAVIKSFNDYPMDQGENNGQQE